MVVTDFEDIALFDPKEAKDWRQAGRRPTPKELHASVQSVSSNSSNSSDTSSLRSSLSSFSSPALVQAQFGDNVDAQKMVPKMPPTIQESNEAPLNDASKHISGPRGRRSVPTLLDNTSMASLTMNAATRSRKQRELDFEADKDDDVYPGDSLMFNVPMSPALYAQQRKRPGPNNTLQKPLGQPTHRSTPPPGNYEPPNSNRAPSPHTSTPNRRRNGAKSPSPLQNQVIPRSRSSGRHSLPSINENRDMVDPHAIEGDFDFDDRPNYRGSGSMSLPALLSRRGSCADDSVGSIEGLNPDASDITLELAKLEQRQESRRNSAASSRNRDSVRDSMGDSTVVSISSLAMSDSEPLPSPALRNSTDSTSSNDSRRSSLTRPENLPPKDPESEKKHLREYEQLLKDAAAAEKKKQQKREENAKKRAQQARADFTTWSQWLKTGSRVSSDLKWRGVPEQLRGAVWYKVKGHENAGLEHRPVGGHSRDAHAAIVADSENIWPECAIFGHGRPLHDSLVFVVQRFLDCRPEVRYGQSLVGFAALLLLYLDAPQALRVLLNSLVPGSLPFAILSGNERIASANYVSFQKLFTTKFPALAAHFAKKSVTATELLDPLVSGVFTTVMPAPELAARLVDVFIFDGDAFLLRAALGLLRINEAYLYASKPEILYEIQHPRVESEDDTMKTVREVTRK